jgi:hypothetical protein
MSHAVKTAKLTNCIAGPSRCSRTLLCALCRWLRCKGAKPAALIEKSKSLHDAERAVRNALEIVL